MYDWADSAFATSILAAVLPVYFASLVPEGGVTLRWAGASLTTSASGLWAYSISSSLLVAALSAPILGALADFSRSKKKFLCVFTYTGAVFSSLLYFVQRGDWFLCLILFMAANIGFAGSMPFYNAFLPEAADGRQIDWVSGKGYAFGYLGGGLLLALHALVITYHEVFGIPDQALSIRLSLASVGNGPVGEPAPCHYFGHLVFFSGDYPVESGGRGKRTASGHGREERRLAEGGMKWSTS